MYSSMKWCIHVYHVCTYISIYMYTYIYVNWVTLPHCLTHSEKECDLQCTHEYSIHEYNTYLTVLGMYSCIPRESQYHTVSRTVRERESHGDSHDVTCRVMCHDVTCYECRCVCVAVCCSVLQYVAACCSVLQCVNALWGPQRGNVSPRVSSMTSCVAFCAMIRHKCVAVCCGVLQCVAVCCSVLQCVAACCSVLQCVAVCCSVLQCVAVCCSVLPCVAMCRMMWHNVGRTVRLKWYIQVMHSSEVAWCGMLQRVAACCSVLQRVAACCSVMQCIAGLIVTLKYDTLPFEKRARACCSVLWCVSVCCSVLWCFATFGSVLQFLW